MVGHLIEQPAKPLDSRWHCLNTLKNAPLTVIINCSWDNKRFVVPVKPQSDSVVDYYDEPSDEGLYGFTTLFTLIKKVKAQIPTIYMWEEAGGLALTCGANHVFADEWEDTMLCRLVLNTEVEVPVEVLEDGREAVVVTIGYADAVKKEKASVVTRCLAKGDVYG
ncbi:hypothetical protein ACHAXN_010359 [Cyclotella atomus]